MAKTRESFDLATADQQERAIVSMRRHLFQTRYQIQIGTDDRAGVVCMLHSVSFHSCLMRRKVSSPNSLAWENSLVNSMIFGGTLPRSKIKPPVRTVRPASKCRKKASALSATLAEPTRAPKKLLISVMLNLPSRNAYKMPVDGVLSGSRRWPMSVLPS